MHSKPGNITKRFTSKCGYRVIISLYLLAINSGLIKAEEFRHVWTAELSSAIWSSPAISKQRNIYVGTEDGVVHAFDKSGSQIWKFDSSGRILSSPAIMPDERVVVGSSDGFLYVLDENGSLSWKYDVGAAVDGSSAIASNGTIYVGADNGYFYALSLHGELMWRRDLGGIIDSSVAISPSGVLYVGTREGDLFAIRQSGEVLWQREIGAITSSPAVGYDGTLYIGSLDNSVYAFEPDGSLKWRFSTDSWVWSSPVLGTSGTVYVGSLDGAVYAIEPNGILKWRYQTDAMIDSSPVIGNDDILYVGSRDNYLYALNGATGDLVWKHNLEAGIYSSPIIDREGYIYVGTVYGKLFQFSGRGQKLGHSAWPSKGNNSGNTGSPSTSPGSRLINFESEGIKQTEIKNDRDFPWFVKNNSLLNGSFSLHSPQLSRGEETTFTLISRNLSGLVSFDFKMYNNKDENFSFYVNGEIVQSWKNNTPASRFSHDLNKGTNRLMWKYSSKEDVTQLGQVVVDNISFPGLLNEVSHDLSGDGKDDVIIRRPETGENIIIDMVSNEKRVINFGPDVNDIPLLGDSDGDGVNELWIRTPSTGYFSFNNNTSPIYFGALNSDVPIPADYDGDGKTDVAIRRAHLGQFIIRYSSTKRIKRYRFGLRASDIPIPADFDGDGLADIAIRRPETSQFIMRLSQSREIVWSTFGKSPTDIPISADYDGDGIADLAVFRELGNTVVWLIRESGSTTNRVRKVSVPKLTNGILPLIADLNHDNKADIAFYDNENGSIVLWDTNTQSLVELMKTKPGDIPMSLPIMEKMALIKKFGEHKIDAHLPRNSKERGSSSVIYQETHFSVTDEYYDAETLGEEAQVFDCSSSTTSCDIP